MSRVRSIEAGRERYAFIAAYGTYSCRTHGVRAMPVRNRSSQIEVASLTSASPVPHNHAKPSLMYELYNRVGM